MANTKSKRLNIEKPCVLSDFVGSCRICVKKSNTMKDMFLPDSTYVKDIQFCTGILITKIANLPTSICLECIAHLNISLKFRNTCINSDNIFQSLLNPIKVEVKIEAYPEHSTHVKEENQYLDDDDDDLFNKDRNNVKDISDDVKNVTNDVKDAKNNVKSVKKEVKDDDMDYFIDDDEDDSTDDDDNDDSIDDDDSNISDSAVRKLPKKAKSKPKKEKKVPQVKYKTKATKKKKIPQVKYRAYNCITCQLLFKTTQESLEHYRKVHNMVDKLVCEVCGKQFTHYGSHYSHVRTHGPPKYTCAYCDYMTPRKTDLVKHVRVHTGEAKYHCHVCPNSFKTSSNLVAHINRHHSKGNRRKHPCDRCDKSFYTRCKLLRHIDSHDNIKRYECEVCHTCFARRCYWKKHLKKVHSVELPPERPGRRKSTITVADTPNVFNK